MAVLALLTLGASEDKAEKKRELVRLEGKAAATDFNKLYDDRLKAYSESTGDRRPAYIVSSNMRVVDAPEMTRLLEDSAKKLLEGWTGTYKPTLRFFITADSAPDARAYGTGVILFSTGLLDNIPDQHSLAFVLAHELGHILADHDGKRQKLIDATQKVVQVTGSALVYSDALRGSRYENDELKLQSRASTADLLVMSYAADAITTDAIAPAVARGQEYDADKIAIDLLVRAGYSAEASFGAIDMLMKAEAKPHIRLERMQALTTALMMSKVVDKSKQGKEKDMNQLLTAGVGVATAVATKVVDLFAGGEADPDERREKFRSYRKDAYSDMFPGANDVVIATLKTNFDKAKAVPAWRGLVNTARLASEAREKMETSLAVTANNLDKPETIQAVPPMPAITTIPANISVPTTLELRGDLAQAKNDRAGAIAEWQSGSRSPWASKSLYQKLGREYLNASNLRLLTTTINNGKVRSGSPLDFLDLEVGAARLGKNMVQAEKLTARCLLEGGVELYTRCAMAIGYDAACTPRTEEAKLDFAAARLKTNFDGLVNVTGQVDKAIEKGGKKKNAQPLQCADQNPTTTLMSSAKSSR